MLSFLSAGRVGYMPLGVLCNYIVVIIDQSNAAMPLYFILIWPYELPLITCASTLQNVKCQSNIHE